MQFEGEVMNVDTGMDQAGDSTTRIKVNFPHDRYVVEASDLRVQPQRTVILTFDGKTKLEAQVKKVVSKKDVTTVVFLIDGSQTETTKQIDQLLGYRVPITVE